MNRSIYIFCSIFIFLSFSLAKNQETSISGTVYRNEEAFPLQGANVTLLNTNGDEYGMSTDENGFIQTSLLPTKHRLNFKSIDGKSCSVQLPEKLNIDNNLLVLDEPLVCVASQHNKKTPHS